MTEFTYITGRLTLHAEMPGGAKDDSLIAEIIIRQMDILSDLVNLAHEQEKQHAINSKSRS